METGDLDWAVATTQPCHEAVAASGLDRLGITNYTPRFCDHLNRTRVLFPGYLFVAQVGDWWSARHTRGITNIIGRISGERLRRWMTPDGMVEVEDAFAPGQAVMLPKLCDIPGMCDGMIGSDRIWVLYEFMGRRVRSSFRRADLKLA